MKKIIYKQIIITTMAIILMVSTCPAGMDKTGAKTDETSKKSFSSSEVKSISDTEFENKHLSMSIDNESSAVMLKIKNSGKVWSTNPLPEELEKIGNKNIRDELSAQVVIFYATATGKDLIIDNYTESIAKKQFEIKNLSDGFRVEYIIGNPEGAILIPEAIEAKRFEAYLSKMSDEDKEDVLSYYNFYHYDDIESESAKKELLTRIPELETYDVYVSRKLAPKVEKRLAEIFVATGMKATDLFSAYEEIGFVSEGKDTVRFLISIEYRLDNEGLTVTIPKDSIEYDRKQYFMKNISLLRYFGAQGEGHDGYIFVPDGSGAIINLDTTRAANFSKPIYGDDHAYSGKEFTGYTENATLPIYGLKSDDDAFLAIIEKNASIARVSAGSSINSQGYNFVHGDFLITPSEYYRMSIRSRTGMTMYSEAELFEDIATRYYFLSGEKANYSGMAEKYREYVFGDCEKIKAGTRSPLFLEAYGSIRKTNYDWGVPIRVKEELTTYHQAIAIITELNANGIESIDFKYSGWANGGMENKTPNTVFLMRNLGGKSDFQDLLDFFTNGSNRFYPDIDLEYVKVNTWFDGFNPKKDVARNLDNKIAIRSDFNVATLIPDSNTYRYLISSDKYLSFAKDFEEAYSRSLQSGISFGTLGEDLNSNFHIDKNEISREESAINIVETMKYFADRDYEIMTKSGNSYIFPYVSKIIDIPLDGSNYDIEEESIPFLQMVLHGYIDYAGSAINLAGDYEDMFLKSIESGASLNYVANYAKTEVVKNTDYSYMFATEFNSIKSEIIRDYKETAKLLDLVRGEVIRSHTIGPNGLRITEYENGIKALVNYTEKDITYENIVVPAKGHIVQQ